jgi:hypothetical protein
MHQYLEIQRFHLHNLDHLKTTKSPPTLVSVRRLEMYEWKSIVNVACVDRQSCTHSYTYHTDEG